MKSGFRDTLDYILTTHGMRTRNIIGTVVYGGKLKHEIQIELERLGYRVERGLDKSNYDFIVLSKGKSTFENVKLGLTKLMNGCIIVFRVNESTTKLLMGKNHSHYSPSLYEFDTDRIDRYLGVIVKGTRHEGKP